MKLYILSALFSSLIFALPAHQDTQKASAALTFGEWTSCGNAEVDSYVIEDVQVSQYMGKASIHLYGQVKREIKEGAVLLSALTVGKYPISVQKSDFCEFLRNQPQAPKCPIGEGKMDMTLHLTIPPNMMPSDYTLQSLIMDADEQSIACLTGGFSVPAL